MFSSTQKKKDKKLNHLLSYNHLSFPPLVTTRLLSISMDCFPFLLNISYQRNHKPVTFSVWLFFFNLSMLFRFIQDVACISTLLLFMPE